MIHLEKKSTALDRNEIPNTFGEKRNYSPIFNGSNTGSEEMIQWAAKFTNRIQCYFTLYTLKTDRF